eukprot:30017-Pelagococcus_subviridis.AAC.15
MPCTSGSALYACTTARTSSSVASPGRSVPKDWIPASSHAFFLLRTYVSLSLRSPTRTTARPGTFPPVFSFMAATASRTSSRTSAAIALPSMTCASARIVDRTGRETRARGADALRELAREAPRRAGACMACIVAGGAARCEH